MRQVDMRSVSNRSSSLSSLSPRAAWLLFWFSLIGLATLMVSIRRDGSIGGLHPLGSAERIPGIPGAGNLHRNISGLESDAELLLRREEIREPHLALTYEQPDTMAAFVTHLQQLAYGNRTEPVRILHYGDSILTSDELSGRARYVLQNRFGDGGHGFVLFIRPWRWYRHIGVRQGATVDGWTIHPFNASPVADRIYGLGGVAFRAVRGKRASAWIATAADSNQGRQVRFFDISYLQQPGGGSFDIHVEREYHSTVQTGSARTAVAHEIVEVPLGKSRIQVTPRNDGRIRIFGVVMETGETGIVYDSLAINGARGPALSRMDPDHWAAEIAYRNPSLVMIMMGANEGASESLNISGYRKEFAEVLATVQRGAVDASCLILGPMDQAEYSSAGKLQSRKNIVRLNAVQREVALAAGCAFFDTFEAMGGDGSMPRWCRSGLGAADLIHPTKEGARLLGNWIAEALLFEFQRFGNKDRRHL